MYTKSYKYKRMHSVLTNSARTVACIYAELRITIV